VDEALGFAGAGAADPPRPDAEILPAAAHRRKPEGTRNRTVPKVALESLSVCLIAARDPTEQHGERQAPTRAWMTTGEPLLSRRRSVVFSRPHPSTLDAAITLAVAA